MKNATHWVVLAILCIPEFMVSQITVVNSRNASYFGITPIKLSIIPPPGFIFLPDPSIFTRNGEAPDVSQYQLNGSKIFWNYPEIRDSLTRGVAASDIIAYKINNYEAVLINQKIINGSQSVNTMVLAFGNSSYTYLLNAFYPGADAGTGNQMRSAILSAYVDTFGYSKYPPPKALKAAQRLRAGGIKQLTPSFHINTTGTNFKVAETVGESIIFYTQDGAYPTYGADKSFLKISKVTAIVSSDQQEAYSKQLLYNYTEFSNIAITSSNKLQGQTDGLDGYEVMCTANAGNGGGAVQVTVYQRTLFDNGLVYVLTGISYSGAATTSTETFKSLINTFTRQ